MDTRCTRAHSQYDPHVLSVAISVTTVLQTLRFHYLLVQEAVAVHTHLSLVALYAIVGLILCLAANACVSIDVAVAVHG